MLLKVINDILDFSKIEAGKVQLENIPFNLREIIEEVAALLAPLASAKNLELSCFLPSDMPTGVYGDPTRLRQILVNLVGNALKFTSTGEVSINAGMLDCGDGTVRVGIDVTDTGIGMSAATVNNLFSSFMQADTTTTRKFGGTGLGLAISHQLAVLMGGGIDVSSVEGSGSTFSLRLPFGLQTVQDNAEELFVGENVRILIVDDSKTNRLILDHYLTGWGISHDVAVDGVHGWQLVRQSVQSGQPYTAVLLDLQMPRSDGFELAAKIRADAASANTKIVVVSSSGIEAVHEHPALVDYAVSKPVRQSVLRSIVREIVSPETKRQKAPPARTEVGGSELSGRVLLVEDTFVNRRVGQGMLARLGVEVEVAVDGSDALNVLGEQTFDVVLMDCQMPVMDGFDATRKFRQKEADDAHTYTPIVALTADVMAGTEQKCIAAGMDSYLSKPYTLTELADALRPWLPSSSSEKSVEKQAAESVHTSLLGAPKPQNDQARVRNLESYAVLDTESEEVFDRITRLAANFLNMPICLVSLIDGERQWFKSRTGLEAVQTPREQAFCGYTILGSDVFVVEDATSDERFASNPLVFSDPNIRFYAGAPLLSEAGFNLGSLCVIDTKPRTLDVEQQVLLSDLAGLVCRELEIRKAQFTDSVTGTFNRAGIFFQGSRQLAKAHHENVPLSVAVVSLNNLKAINDFLGADAGDVALRCVADVATSVLREHDTVGRLGGGMFAFIMPGLSAAQAGGVVGDVLSEIGEQNIFPTGHDLLLSATAGVASSDVYETDFTKVYNRADGAFSAAQFENVPVVCAD